MFIFLPMDQEQQSDHPRVANKSTPQIVIYALADARDALEAAAACNIQITLVSPAGAAGFAGPAWFREVVTQAGDAVPTATFDAVLDCAADAGYAMAAMRDGATAICFEGPQDVRAKIQDVAAQSGCMIATIDYEHALDLEDSDDALRACRDWLALKTAENDT